MSRQTAITRKLKVWMCLTVADTSIKLSANIKNNHISPRRWIIVILFNSSLGAAFLALSADNLNTHWNEGKNSSAFELDLNIYLTYRILLIIVLPVAGTISRSALLNNGSPRPKSSSCCFFAILRGCCPFYWLLKSPHKAWPLAFVPIWMTVAYLPSRLFSAVVLANCD